MSLLHACLQIRRVAAGAFVVLAFAGWYAGDVSAQESGDAVTIELEEVSRSGISGEVTLTPDGDQTSVDMTLVGEVEGNHPTHIHTGTCFNFDPNPLYPLETVVLEPVNDSGVSETTVDVSLEELESSDYVILVHRSPEALTDYLVCGEIPRLTTTTGQAAGSNSGDHEHSGTGGNTAKKGDTTTLPVAGNGSANAEASERPLSAALVLFALLTLIAAAAAQRMRTR